MDIKFINERLTGKTISCVRLMTDEQMKIMHWYKKSIVIEFTDGLTMVPLSDEEGNEPGSLLFDGEYVNNPDGSPLVL